MNTIDLALVVIFIAVYALGWKLYQLERDRQERNRITKRIRRFSK